MKLTFGRLWVYLYRRHDWAWGWLVLPRERVLSLGPVEFRYQR